MHFYHADKIVNAYQRLFGGSSRLDHHQRLQTGVGHRDRYSPVSVGMVDPGLNEGPHVEEVPPAEVIRVAGVEHLTPIAFPRVVASDGLLLLLSPIVSQNQQLPDAAVCRRRQAVTAA